MADEKAYREQGKSTSNKRRYSQRELIYKAQAEIDPGKELSGSLEVEAYLKQITSSKWWVGRFSEKLQISRHDNGFPILYVIDSKTGFKHKVEVISLHPRELAILHRVAQVVTWKQYDREFAALFLELVTRFMGKEAGKNLRLAYVKHGVVYRHGKSVLTKAVTLKLGKGKEITVQGDRGKDKVKISGIGTLASAEAEQLGEAIRIAVNRVRAWY